MTTPRPGPPRPSAPGVAQRITAARWLAFTDSYHHDWLQGLIGPMGLFDTDRLRVCWAKHRGLTSARRLVQWMGGRLDPTNQAGQGNGCRFVIRSACQPHRDRRCGRVAVRWGG